MVVNLWYNDLNQNKQEGFYMGDSSLVPVPPVAATLSQEQLEPYYVPIDKQVQQLKNQGYYALVEEIIDDEQIVSPDEIAESVRECCLRLVKSKMDTQTKSKNGYVQGNLYGGLQQFGAEQGKPKTKNKFRAEIIAFFIISNVSMIYLDKNRSYLRLKCTSIRGKFEVFLSMNDFNQRKIKRIIENRVNCQAFPTNYSDKKLNDLMFVYIRNKFLQNEQVYKLLDKPGFYQRDKKDWRFVSCDKNCSIMSSAVNAAHFDVQIFDVQTAQKIVMEYCHLIKDSDTIQMALLRLSGLLLTPLSSMGYHLDKTIIFYGCNSNEKKKFFATWLKVYNRRDFSVSQVYKLSALKQSQIKRIATDNKDCVILFDDNTVTANSARMTDSEMKKAELLAELFAFHQSEEQMEAECQCAVISNRYMNIEVLADEAFLFYDVSNMNFGDMERVNELCDWFDKVVVDFVKSFFEKYRNSFEIIDREAVEDFEYNTSKNAYLMLNMCISVFRKICAVYECDVFTEDDFQDWSDKVYNIVMDSEYFNDEQAMIDEFADKLNEWIICEKMILADCNVLNLSISDEKTVIYVKEDLLLIKPELFKEILRAVPVFVADADGTRLRQILAENELLACNFGDKDKKYLYKASIAEGSKRENFIAISTKILEEEAISKLPTKGESIHQAVRTDDTTERIKLGVSDNHQPVYWSIGAGLMNQHLFVRGKSGSGKTYFLTTLAKKLHDANKRVIILDCAEFSGYDKTELLKVLPENDIENNITISPEIIAIPEAVSDENKIMVMRSTAEEAETFLKQLMKYCEEHKADGKETFVIFDEIAGLDISGSTPLGKAILQGRKIHLNVITATQILCGEGVREKVAILSECSVHVAFSMDKKMRSETAREIDKEKASAYEEQLKNLSRGEALVYSELEDISGVIKQDQCVKMKVTVD